MSACGRWQEEVSAGVGRRGVSAYSRHGIIASIDSEAAHVDGREFIDFPGNVLHSNFLSLFNQYGLHLSNHMKQLQRTAPLFAILLLL